MGELRKRPRLTLTSMILSAAVCATLLGCYVGVRRMKQRQAHYRRMATQYAEREQLERDKRASFMQHAVWEMHFIKRQAQWLEEAASGRGPLRDLRYSELGRQEMASRLRLYNQALASGREIMEFADKAKIRAAFFLKLRNKYEKASSSLWFALLEGSPKPGPIEMGAPRYDDSH
jgi:hypothetical protein